MDLEDLTLPEAGAAKQPLQPLEYANRHTIFLMDPRTGVVERRTMSPNSHLGAVES